jgi:hypothetical protein
MAHAAIPSALRPSVDRMALPTALGFAFALTGIRVYRSSESHVSYAIANGHVVQPGTVSLSLIPNLRPSTSA